jgi:GcrA cell cycle regulator
MSDIDDKMIELWEQGVSASQIAKQLGVTRNAVAGKLHRFKFSGRIAQKNAIKRFDAIKKDVRQLEKERRTIANAQANPNISVYKIEDKLISLPKITKEIFTDSVNLIVCEEAPAPVGKNLQFDQLTAKSCRFIINDGPVKDFLFCGKEKSSKSYCKEHAGLCYYKLLRRSDNDDKTKSS